LKQNKALLAEKANPGLALHQILERLDKIEKRLDKIEKRKAPVELKK
jgi:hypothetical protein